MKRFFTVLLFSTLLFVLFSISVFATETDGAVELTDVFSFLGYSVNEEQSALSIGYTVNRDLLDAYCTENKIGAFDFGCIFGVNSVVGGSYVSFANYSDYQSFSARVDAIDKTNDRHLNTPLAIAFYIDRGHGKEYLVEIDGVVSIVGAQKVPLVKLSQFIK